MTQPAPTSRSIATEHEPYAALVRALRAHAAEPHRLRPRIALARCWADLAFLQPPGAAPEVWKPRTGHTLRSDGQLQNVAHTARALLLLDALIDRGVPNLFELRAELLCGWSRHREAAADLRRAAQACPPGQHGAYARRTLELRACHLEYRALAEPTAAELQDLRERAERMGARMARLHVAPPVATNVYSRASIDLPVDPRLDEMDRLVHAEGCLPLAWVDERMTGGGRFARGVWRDPAGSVVIEAVTHEHRALVSATTELAGGRFLETLSYGGVGLFDYGPHHDILRWPGPWSTRALLEMHSARLAAALADEPSSEILPLLTPDDYLLHTRRVRAAKDAFRWHHGLSEVEARGCAMLWPDAYVPMVREAVIDAVRATGVPPRRGAE